MLSIFKCDLQQFMDKLCILEEKSTITMNNMERIKLQHVELFMKYLLFNPQICFSLLFINKLNLKQKKVQENHISGES